MFPVSNWICRKQSVSAFNYVQHLRSIFKPILEAPTYLVSTRKSVTLLLKSGSLRTFKYETGLISTSYFKAELQFGISPKAIVLTLPKKPDEINSPTTFTS